MKGVEYKKMAKVKIYTTQNCVYCKLAKEYFKKNNIQVEEVDVGKDQKAAEEMIQKSGQMGVPVIEANGKIIIGFDRDAIKDALNLH